MRVYLIAAPEDEGDAEKLAAYLKRFGVFIRSDYGRMAYPPAHHGEFTLALWSRNAMMSSRQMMLTNRAIDAWEDDRLVMARLDPGLSPRGLSDLKMVDLSFAAAREHRYHDVLNALRAVEDAQRRLSEHMSEGTVLFQSGPDELNESEEETEPGDEKVAKAVERIAGELRQAEHGRGALALSASIGDVVDDSTHEVFVSYSHQNAETVLPIVDTVEARGLSIWIDREEMRAGQSWAGQIVRAIKSAERFCLMCSEQAFASDHVRREVYLADKYGKAMVPIRLDGSEMPDDIEYFMIGQQWVDLNALEGDERIEALEAALSGAAS